MSIVLIAKNRDMEPFKNALLHLDSNLDIEIWPEVRNKNRITYAVVWRHPGHLLDSFPNLKVVSSLGAGVDHLIRDDTIPEQVELTRVVTPSLVSQMIDYIKASCYLILRRFESYFQQKQNNLWEVQPHFQKDQLSVGLMGLGAIGREVAEAMAADGWIVNGWSRSRKEIDQITAYAGKEELEKFLQTTNIVVSLLPLTRETEGILDLKLFKMLKNPSWLINVGRGEQLVEEDLVYALDTGLLDGAVLDVFEEEPLPDRHPFWNRPGIVITPHVAALTEPEELAVELLENYKRMTSDIPLKNRVDRSREY